MKRLLKLVRNMEKRTDKSVHKTRMAENLDVFDFELSDDDMQKMSSLDKNESQFFDHRDPEAIVSIFGESLKALRK